MLSEATKEICRNLNYPRCSVRIFGDPDKVFEHHAADLPADVPITPCSQHFPGSRATFETGRSVVVNDMGRLVDPCMKSEMERVRLKAYLGTPLYYCEELLGVLCFSYSDPHEWKEDEITTAAAIANQIAMAIRHDRMLEERERNRKELSRLATAVEQSVEAICITDLEGTIQYVNQSYERITGYSREEAVGKNPRILRSGRGADDPGRPRASGAGPDEPEPQRAGCHAGRRSTRH
jgi:GAF domain-containing protein